MPAIKYNCIIFKGSVGVCYMKKIMITILYMKILAQIIIGYDYDLSVPKTHVRVLKKDGNLCKHKVNAGCFNIMRTRQSYFKLFT